MVEVPAAAAILRVCSASGPCSLRSRTAAETRSTRGLRTTARSVPSLFRLADELMVLPCSHNGSTFTITL
ncbi:Uncharacterised protein [Mycobacteroides abscessus subsp. abscessus]|nr:Uncharacterised protein [Mycobacteroides abscessus subsp. abscessus]